jgi:hypothetical protein
VSFPWWFYNPGRAYAQARENKARRESAADEVPERDLNSFRTSLDGTDSFRFGVLRDGREVRITPRVVGMPSLVFGASGKGKTRLIHLLMEGWSGARKSKRRLQLVDPKGETFLLEATHLAARFLALPEEKRGEFVARIHVLDTSEEAVTPLNLFDRRSGSIDIAFLANMRAAATRQASPHEFSDLMEFGVSIVYAAVIALEFPLTFRFAQRLLGDDAFRRRVVIPRMPDPLLRATLENLETALPGQTRAAVLRQLHKLLSTRAVRVAMGLSPSMVAELVPRKNADIMLANCAVSMAVPLTVAREQAIQRVLDVLLEATARPERLYELLVIEELPVLLKERSNLGEFIVEASRTLRWKGLSMLCCAQDPVNAFPAEILRTLLLNLRWIAGFECGRDEAMWFYPYLSQTPAATKLGDSERRQRFLREMQTLARQEFYFHLKGSPAVRIRTTDVPDAVALVPGRSEVQLLEIFRREIASTSMVRIPEAEAHLEQWEAEVLDRGEVESPAVTTIGGRSSSPRRARSIRDLLDMLEGKQGGSDTDD